jgi:hypothetical protein
MLKKLLENGGLIFNHEWEYGGKRFKADFEIEVEEINEKEVQVTVDLINNYTNYLNEIAVCLFNEKYKLDETEQFLLDLEAQDLEFIVNKLEEIL